MMKYKTFMASLLLVLTGCSTTTSQDTESSQSEFIGGGITLIYSKKGEFLGLSSKATAQATGKLQSSVDSAIAVATLKARRQIAEFISVELSSERFVTTVSVDLQESKDNEDNLDKQSATQIALILRETIKQRSNQLLKGTVVESETYNDESRVVVVVVRAGSKERKASDALKKMISK
jgi:hypothetical protein